MTVGHGEPLRLERQTEPRHARGIHTASFDFRQRVDNLGVPPCGEGTDGLLNEAIGRIQGQVARSGQNNGARAIVWCNWLVPGLGEGCDLLGFRQASAPGEVKHHKIKRIGLEELPESTARGQGLAAADRETGALA